MDLVSNLLLQWDSRVTLAALAVAAGLASGLAVRKLLRLRSTPAERERKRRLAVNSKGRLCDTTIVEVRDNTLYYSYLIGGVNYMASQDLTSLRELLPADLGTLIGPASLKYLPRNPANSIVVCENWSGVRTRLLASGA
jgi:hypothetical protein